MGRSTLIKSICENLKDHVLFSAPGYRTVIFRDNTVATRKTTRGDGENNNTAGALGVVAERVFKNGLSPSDTQLKISSKGSQKNLHHIPSSSYAVIRALATCSTTFVSRR